MLWYAVVWGKMLSFVSKCQCSFDDNSHSLHAPWSLLSTLSTDHAEEERHGWCLQQGISCTEFPLWVQLMWVNRMISKLCLGPFPPQNWKKASSSYFYLILIKTWGEIEILWRQFWPLKLKNHHQKQAIQITKNDSTSSGPGRKVCFGGHYTLSLWKSSHSLIPVDSIYA